MRSTVSSAMPPSEAAPPTAAFSGTPSTSTSTWLEFAPRTNSDEALPGPPLRANCTPASRDSVPTRSDSCQRSISARVITVVDGSASSID